MKKIIKSLFVLIISFVIFNGLVIKAETISSGTISIDKPVDNYDLITDCNAGEGQTGFTCSIKKWYKGGSNENPQLDVGLEGKYTTIKEFTSEDELLEYTTKTKKGNTYYFKVRSYTVLEDSSKVYSPYSSVKSIKSK